MFGNKLKQQAGIPMQDAGGMGNMPGQQDDSGMDQGMMQQMMAQIKPMMEQMMKQMLAQMIGQQGGNESQPAPLPQ